MTSFSVPCHFLLMSHYLKSVLIIHTQLIFNLCVLITVHMKKKLYVNTKDCFSTMSKFFNIWSHSLKYSEYLLILRREQLWVYKLCQGVKNFLAQESSAKLIKWNISECQEIFCSGNTTRFIKWNISKCQEIFCSGNTTSFTLWI